MTNVDNYVDVDIPAGSGRRISINMWSAAILSSGSSSSIQSLAVSYEFFNGSTSLGAAVNIASTTTELGGRPFSISALSMPNAATKVRVRARAVVTWYSSASSGVNTDFRLYSDALTVSVP